MNQGQPHRYLHPVTVHIAEPAIAKAEPTAPLAPDFRQAHVDRRDVTRAVMDALNEYRVEHYDDPEYVVVDHPHAMALDHWGVGKLCGVRVLDARDLADARSEPEPVDVAEYLTERLRKESDHGSEAA